MYQTNPSQHIIIVEGNIGVGKSTLLPRLARTLHEKTGHRFEVIPEAVDTDPKFQELLAAFTNDPMRRIEFQRYITQSRADIVSTLSADTHYILERSLFSDLIFATANLFNTPRPDGMDLDYYYDIAHKLSHYPNVDAILYLNAEPQVCYDRMCQRNREAEAGTPLDYLQLIGDMHNTLLPQMSLRYNTPLVTVEYNQFVQTEKIADALLLQTTITSNSTSNIKEQVA